MLVLCAGCGRLGFGSDEPHADARAIDATADAWSCVAPVGHDEDGDGFDDVCDRCPQLADDQADGDRDGVGDACDLSETAQARTFFDAFTSMRPEWTYGQRVTFLGDAVGLPAVGDSVGLFTGMPGRELFETGGRIAGGGMGSRQFAIHIGERGGTSDLYCELYDNGMSAKLGMTYSLDGGTSYTSIASTPGPTPIENASFRIVFEHAPPDLRCVAWWNGVRYEVTGLAPIGVVARDLSLGANNIDVELDYFVRLTTP